jgi:hypothetical protein
MLFRSKIMPPDRAPLSQSHAPAVSGDQLPIRLAVTRNDGSDHERDEGAKRHWYDVLGRPLPKRVAHNSRSYERKNQAPH